MKLKAIIGSILGLVIIVIALVACVWLVGKMRDAVSNNNETPTETPSQVPTSPTVTNDDNLPAQIALGNPSNATADVSNVNNFLLTNRYYAISYNRDKNLANWVSWKVSKNNFGDASRQNDFRPDDKLPAGWTRVTPFDYNGSGFDRGHLCPSADRSSSVEANSTTFLMSNIAPQTPELNQGPWEKLESYARSLARRNATLYIVAGHYGERGKVKNKITIPTNFWKIVVVLPNNDDVSSINRDTRVIAVDMPNKAGIKERNWRDFKTTVRQIEQKTGYNFFAGLPNDVQNALETKTDSRQ